MIRLLASGDHTVKEVAGMSGFTDPNYYAKVFRRYFRVSPTEFRKIGLAASIMTMNAETTAPALQKHPVEYQETDTA
ncbi:helix-turn-helix domain-containing protein [Martelella sp. AMO21009]